MNPSGDLICYTGGVYDPAVTDARLAYHSAVHRAARAYFWALDREDALAAVVAHAHLVRAVQAAEASGAYPMPSPAAAERDLGAAAE